MVVNQQTEVMPLQKLVKQATQLSISDRLTLLKAITQSIRQEIDSSNSQESSTKWLRGFLKSDGPPPTDEELKAEYVDYLTQKYQSCELNR